MRAKRNYTSSPKYASGSEREKRNKNLVDIIVSALKGITYDDMDINRVKYKYVLGQAIRQYIIPEENWHLSKNASELWNKITDDKIMWFNYDERFTAKDNIKDIETYKGTTRNTKSFLSLKKGEKYDFKSLFIAEHTTPVSDIIKFLLNIKNPTAKDVIPILDKIHITRMLRKEDRSIDISSNRINDKKMLKEMSSTEIFDKLVADYYNRIELKY